MDTLNTWAEQLEGLPGYDIVVDWVNDKAGEKYQTKDPFYVEVNGKKKRRKVPETCSKDKRKAWKKIQKRAWMDDKNFFGCFPLNLGLGLAPLLALVPVIGPLLMFAIHGRLVTIADQKFHLPTKLVAKMHANILFDLIISIPPVIGSFFTWMNGCSTRNAAMVHTYIVNEESKRVQTNVQNEGPVMDLNYSGQINNSMRNSTNIHSPTRAYDATRV